MFYNICIPISLDDLGIINDLDNRFEKPTDLDTHKRETDLFLEGNDEEKEKGLIKLPRNSYNYKIDNIKNSKSIDEGYFGLNGNSFKSFINVLNSQHFILKVMLKICF